MTRPELYLSELIENGQAACHGYLELSKRIKAANPRLKKGGVDRRKLKAIVDGRPFTISLDELIALDNYFSLYGESLGDRPLFVRQSLLEGLAENHRIVVLLGAFQRDEETRNDVSLWDVQAFQEIISGVQKFREGIQNTLQDVSFLNSKGFHDKDPMVCGSILAKSNQSICGIGSMRSSVATEIMLANMFQVTAFARARRPLPFRFIWPEDAHRKKWEFASAFVTSRSEQRAAETARTAHATGALVVGDRIYDVIPNQWIEIDRPDILIVEGLNVLQAGRLPKDGKAIPFVSDFFDFSVYLDADEDVLLSWYVTRFLTLRGTAFADPKSYFHRYARLTDREATEIATDIWNRINLVNLHENIMPTRPRADLILKKSENHQVEEVALRRL